ncbi:MAG: hypothetical protein HYW07_17585 [Candidatus Latescibacteria bacterium]|nr:hypothetical protein [Candidatus Latescibacterota bacterium]
MYAIGTQKQLFIEERFLAARRGVALTVNPSVKAGAIAVEASTAPCIVEHEGTCYLYQGLNGATSVWTSADGLDWEAHGRLRGVDDAAGLFTSINSVFIDPKDTAYPFKGLHEFIRQAGPGPTEAGGATQAVQPGGLHLCRSRDGLDWEYLPQIAIPFLCDTQNQMLYDPRRDRYAAYVRAFPEVGGPYHFKRCVGRTETDDPYSMPWPHGVNPANVKPAGYDFPYIDDELEIVLGPDGDDPPMTDLYNPCTHVYPGAQDVYLAFPSMYRCWGYGQSNISAGRDHRGTFANDGLFETQLAVSRDGVQFTRYRVPYLHAGLVRNRAGSEGDLDCGLMMMGIGMLCRGDEIWQYYFAGRRTHEAKEQAQKNGRRGEGLFRAVQRLDGFVSVDAGQGGGEFTTPPLVFAGNRLVLNAACHGLGEIWVEIQDESGAPVPGFTRADSISIDRNGTAQEVWWKGGPDLSSLVGRPVRLRFVLRSAKLFAFQFALQ